MKNFLIIPILLFSFPLFGQKVYKVEYESQADLKVFIVKYESQASEDGLWYVVKYESQALSPVKVFLSMRKGHDLHSRAGLFHPSILSAKLFLPWIRARHLSLFYVQTVTGS